MSYCTAVKRPSNGRFCMRSFCRTVKHARLSVRCGNYTGIAAYKRAMYTATYARPMYSRHAMSNCHSVTRGCQIADYVCHTALLSNGCQTVFPVCDPTDGQSYSHICRFETALIPPLLRLHGPCGNICTHAPCFPDMPLSNGRFCMSYCTTSVKRSFLNAVLN